MKLIAVALGVVVVIALNVLALVGSEVRTGGGTGGTASPVYSGDGWWRETPAAKSSGSSGSSGSGGSTLSSENLSTLPSLGGSAPPLEPVEKTYTCIGSGGSYFDGDHWSIYETGLGASAAAQVKAQGAMNGGIVTCA